MSNSVLASFIFLENRDSKTIMTLTETIEPGALVVSIIEGDKEAHIRLTMGQTCALSQLLPRFGQNIHRSPLDSDHCSAVYIDTPIM